VCTEVWFCFQLPEHGLLPEQEVEAAVDLIAPEKPGRYVAHWRLASAAGPKFGHRVWVVIQVGAILCSRREYECYMFIPANDNFCTLVIDLKEVWEFQIKTG
jgi:hypothetical protein